MKRLLTLAFGVLVALTATAVLIRPAAAQQSGGWSVAIEENPGLTNCGSTKNIPVAGATDCPTAEAAAWNLLKTLLSTPGCMNSGCPTGYTIEQGVSSCTANPYTRPNGSLAKRWQVSWTWKCVPPVATPSLPCCECLGNATTLDLSTGQGSPIDPLWSVNGSSAFTTPRISFWIALPGAQWIQPVASPLPSNNVPAGVYKYTVRFNIPKCTIPSDVRLDGKFSADNGGNAFLDNMPVGSCPGPLCLTGSVPLTVNSAWLTPGNHTLEIDVTNKELWSGLVVNAKLTRQCHKGP
jgi:hypothetical protein